MRIYQIIYLQLFLLHFWASWCDNCRSEVPILAKYKHLIPVIGVDYKDTPQAAQQMMALCSTIKQQKKFVILIYWMEAASKYYL